MMAVAVIGMSCRFPDANNVEEFWQNLIDGKDSVRSMPADRWYMAGEEDLVAGYLKCPLDEFDSNFFNISPKEATYVDPQQRLFLEVAWESLESAGIAPSSLDGSETGVWLGIGSDEYYRTQMDVHEDTLYKVLGNTLSAAPGRFSYFLNLCGPSVAVEAACASSAVAVHQACTSLRNGECRLALAGGVTTLLETSTTYPTALISTRCKTFDASANGFAPAEGCGVILLKRLEDALGDGDSILAVIRGSAHNHTAKSSSFGTPSTFTQQKVIRDAMAAAGVEPNEVSFLETHGTGTTVGDATEIRTIEAIYSNASEPRLKPLILGAVKTNLGHPLSAAGVAGLIKMILCMKHRRIPKHLHLKNLNPQIDLERIPAQIPLETMTWSPDRDKPLIGGVSSFGITGTNVHFLLEDGSNLTPSVQSSSPPGPPTQLITISANDEIALNSLRLSYKALIDSNSSDEFSLADFAYSLNTGRSHLSFRVAFLASTKAELSQKLESQDFAKGIVHGNHEPIVFLFTGHGCQYFGMAKSLYEHSEVFRAAFDSCDLAYLNNLGLSLRSFIWEDEGGDMSRTQVSQPAIFCIQICLAELWKSLGVRPELVLGHSIGEFAAAVVSGMLSFSDGMKLVCARSRLVEHLEESRMMALGTSLVRVNELLQAFKVDHSSDWMDIATVNSLNQTVVSGSIEGIRKFKDFCLSRSPGLKTKVLSSKHAFHSRAMDPILDDFERVASEVKCSKPSCIYLSGTTSEICEEVDAEYWRNHLRDTVSFSNALNSVLEKDYKVFVEIGPQPTLLNFLLENNEGKSELLACPSIRNGQECWQTLLTSLSKLYVGGVAKVNFQGLFSGRRIPLPTYPFTRKKCWAAPRTQALPMSRMLGGGKLLHPLLGTKVKMPQFTESRYTSFHSTSSTSFIKDHVIADQVIVPAACYLEMLMAIQRDVGPSSTKSLMIENLEVSRALLLDSKASQVHTMALQGEGGSRNVGFFTADGEDWIQHAQASVRPAGIIPTVPNVDIEALKRACRNGHDGKAIYARLSASGITMGPMLQSLVYKWHDEEESENLVEIHNVKSETAAYTCHPVILDGMIQAYWQFKMRRRDDTPFSLPVRVSSFTWYDVGAQVTDLLYIHMTETAENSVWLYSDQGRLLGLMEGIVLHETTMASFLKSLSIPQTLPQFMSRDLIRAPSSLHGRLQMDKFPNLDQSVVQKHVEICSSWIETHKDVEAGVEELCYRYILNALLEIGWSPVVGDIVTKEIFRSLVSPDSLVDLRVLDTFLCILSEEGLLSPPNQNGERLVLKECPSFHGLAETEGDSAEVNHVKGLGEALPGFLKGTLNPIEFFLRSDRSSLYTEFRQCKLDYQVLVSSFESIFQDSTEFSEGRKLRILEVGAGTGGATQHLLGSLSKLGIAFEYTFTDIGRIFLTEAKKRFEAHSQNMLFEVLDIEKDPKDQGFAPSSFDLVLAYNVIHATEDLGAALENVRHLLTDSGYFFLGEIYEPIRGYALSFEILPSFWKSKDFRTYPIVNAPTWADLFAKTGFVESVDALPLAQYKRGIMVTRAPADNRLRPYSAPTVVKPWLIFSNKGDTIHEHLEAQLKLAGKKVFHVRQAQIFEKTNRTFELNPKRFSDFQQLSHVLKNHTIEGIIFGWGISEPQEEIRDIVKNQEQFVAGFLNLLKTVIAKSWKARVYLLTEGAEGRNPSGGSLWGLLDTYLNEYPEFPATGIDLELGTAPHTSASQIFSLLWGPVLEKGFVWRDGEPFVARLHNFESDLPLPQVLIPNAEKFKLTDATTFQFGSLTLPDSDLTSVEIAVRAVGLNFRDLLLSSGLLPAKDLGSVGLEFAGVVTRSEGTEYSVGDRVVGLTAEGALGNTVVVPGQLLFPIPKGMSFVEAATLPVAFGTCYLSLLDIAKLKAAERVLIHTGTGGVGLAGIQLARLIGAEIYVTAGTRRKRNYLKHCVGLSHVYDSRSVDYSAQILADTEGQGVNVIVNTLTGPGFKEASLACLRPNGRFIELSKLNIWSAEDVKELRADVQYTVLDAFEMITTCAQDMVHTLVELGKLFSSGSLRSLPHRTYPLSQTKAAFQFFHHHQHIGKVIVEVPEVAGHPTRSLFSSESFYLVTGGLGGLGFETVKFILENGGNVVALGRHPPSEEKAAYLEPFGDRIVVVAGDVGDYDTCERVLGSLPGPLRGIFHCAGVFSNNFIVNQSLESFSKVFRPKVYGTWNLHELTKSLDLDYFVVFSSIASLVGSTGLSNYTAGNRYMDSLIAYRVEELGLAGLTINWGPWSDVGAAAGYVSGMFKSFHHFPPEIGISSLERAMQLGLTQVVIADMDRDLGDTTPRLRALLSQLTAHSKQGRSRSAGNELSVGFSNFDSRLQSLVSEIKGASPEERAGKLEALVEICFRAHAGLAENDGLSRDQPLTLMGMDSLIGMELRTRLSKLLGLTIPTNAVIEHNSIRALAQYLTDYVYNNSVPGAESSEPPVSTLTEVPEEPKPKVESGKKSRPISKFLTKKLQKLHSHTDKSHRNNVSMK